MKQPYVSPEWSIIPLDISDFFSTSPNFDFIPDDDNDEVGGKLHW